jgi:hypothetical protein
MRWPLGSLLENRIPPQRCGLEGGSGRSAKQKIQNPTGLWI